MEETPAKIKIECPECEQQFSVPEKYMDKTVECGLCDSRFKVTEDVFAKEKVKFYPGEKKEARLEVFASVGASPQAAKVDFTEARYQTGVNAEKIGPVRPRQTLSLVFGVGIMVVMLLIFLLAGGETGSMRDMITMNRFVLVGFTALLGCFLIMYGSVKNRKIGFLLSLLLGGALCAMPVIFPGNPSSISENSPQKSEVKKVVKKISMQEENDYLQEIGYSPVEELLMKEPRESVVGIYIRNAPESMTSKIVDFLYEETGKVNRGIAYTRGEFSEKKFHSLIVLKHQTKTIDQISIVCAKFGKINKIHYNLRVIDVSIDTSKTISLDPKKSIDQASDQFEQQQLKALQSFDPEVKMAAVKRLGISKPKARRDDITKALLAILPDASNELKLETLKTLAIWSKKGDGAEKTIFNTAQNLHQNKIPLNKVTMNFLISRKVEGTQILLMDLWDDKPVEWADQLIKLADGAEVLLLPELEKMTTVHIVVAADILAKVGTPPSIPYLEKAIKKHDITSEKALKTAINAIKKRAQKEPLSE